MLPTFGYLSQVRPARGPPGQNVRTGFRRAKRRWTRRHFISFSGGYGKETEGGGGDGGVKLETLGGPCRNYRSRALKFQSLDKF